MYPVVYPVVHSVVFLSVGDAVVLDPVGHLIDGRVHIAVLLRFLVLLVGLIVEVVK